jgi:hypothetical protein
LDCCVFNERQARIRINLFFICINIIKCLERHGQGFEQMKKNCINSIATLMRQQT